MKDTDAGLVPGLQSKESFVASALQTPQAAIASAFAAPTPDESSAQWHAMGSALRERQAQLDALDFHAIVSTTDAQGVIVSVNDLFCRISGYERSELIGANHRLLKSGEHSAAFYDELWSEISSGRPWHGTLCNRRKDGSLYWVESSIVPLPGEDGLPQAYVSIRTDVTELKASQASLAASEAALRSAKDAAEAANRAKSEFLANMSHELRTPMNAILGFAQLLQMDRSGGLSRAQRSQVDHIRRAGDHLLALIDEVLDLARIEAGKLVLSMEPVAPKRLVSDCMQLVRPLALGRNVGLTVLEGVDLLPDMQVDYTRSKQVLLNLLSNAIKYNREGGNVTVTGQHIDGRVRLLVRDTGMGIPGALHSHVFEPFQRLGLESGNIEGSGVGLSITKRLVEQMQGRIGFESDPGTGSSFWVEFGRAASSDQQGAAAESANGPALSDPAGRPATVLYVEDNPANQRLMEFILAELPNVRLVSLHSAELALAYVKDELPDLVLMDLNLPGMDGFAALAAMRQDTRTQGIPVIAVTANAMHATTRAGLDAGFTAFLTKPVRVTDVLMQVQAVLDAM
jgi:PAS domain S-box-containing protein